VPWLKGEQSVETGQTHLVIAEYRRKRDDAASSKGIGYEHALGMVFRIGVEDRAVDGLCSASPPSVNTDWWETDLAVAALDLRPLVDIRRVEVTKGRVNGHPQAGLQTNFCTLICVWETL